MGIGVAQAGCVEHRMLRHADPLQVFLAQVYAFEPHQALAPGCLAGTRQGTQLLEEGIVPRGDGFQESLP